MNEEIDITYTVDLKQQVSEVRKRLFRSWQWGRRMLLLSVAGALLYYGGLEHIYAFALPIGGFLGSACVRWIAPARWFAQDPTRQEPKHLRITPERLFLATETVKSEFPWTQFIAWNESPASFMLDLTKAGFCSVIPKSTMTPEQQALFRQWASAKLPKS